MFSNQERQDSPSEPKNQELPSISAQKRFWDWHWHHWQERKVVNDWTLRRGDAILEILRSLPLNQPEVLDFGCGKGWFTEKLATVGRATGIDLSEGAIAMAKARSPHITFFAGNVYDFPFQPNKYDVVVSQEVLTHVENPPAYLKRAAYVLKPGGYLIVACANRFVMDRLGTTEWNIQPPEHISWYPSMGHLKKLLVPDFTVLKATTMLPIGNGGILRLVNSYKLNRAVGLIMSPSTIENLKARAGFGYQLMVLAKKKGQSD